MFHERQKLEDQLAEQAKHHKMAEKQIEKLKQALGTTEAQLRKVSAENRNMTRMHSNEVTRITELHSKSVDEDRRKHDQDMDGWKRKYDQGMDGWKRKYDQGMDGWKRKYDLDIDFERRQQESQRKKNESHLEALKADHKAEVTRLVGQLLVNQENNQGWPDDKLKLKFKELQLLIDLITAPRNKEFLIPPNQQLGQHLDPTNFLGRVGRAKSHFLLRSAIWSVFHEQFFSSPFGFGALGPGKSQRGLMEVYYAWRELFEERTGTVPASFDHEAFAIFHQDKLANKWRAATFQCINAALTTSDDTIPAPDSPLARLSAKNVDQTVARIMAILTEVSNLSSSHVRVEMEHDIHQMVNLGSVIALQFGVHLAQLRILVPSRGEQIQIGESYQDCEDGDCYKGSIYGVDLVTAPGLQKIGDGKSDMSSSRTMVPCEIYPDQPDS
jgi:hypothetical protein